MDVHKTALRLHKAFNWDKDYVADIGPPQPWEEIESVVHEMAHAWCLGNPLIDSDKIGTMLRGLTSIDANHNEALTLAAEEEALELLGVEVDFENIVRNAAFVLDDEKYRDPSRFGQRLYESYRGTEESKMLAKGILWIFENADELIERYSSNGR